MGLNLLRKREDAEALLQAVLLTLPLFVVFVFGFQTYACAPCAVTLSVSVQTSLAFSTTNQGFANTATNITPGTPLMATTTLSVTTNDVAGWNVFLSGSNKVTGHNNLQTSGDTAEITDQTEWVNGAATSTAGNAAQISSLVNSNNVLAFRVAASSTNGGAFNAPTWWGASDNYLTTNAATLYAGISSSTVSRQIGNAGAGSYSVSAHLNDVQYYLSVGVTQQTGSYTAPITFTATGN